MKGNLYNRKGPGDFIKSGLQESHQGT